jgi:hypothetical protein
VRMVNGNENGLRLHGSNPPVEPAESGRRMTCASEGLSSERGRMIWRVVLQNEETARWNRRVINKTCARTKRQRIIQITVDNVNCVW